MDTCNPRYIARELRRAADILDQGDFTAIFAADAIAIRNWLAFVDAASEAGGAPDLGKLEAWWAARPQLRQ